MTSTLPTDFWGRVIYILQNYSASLGRGVLNTMIIAVLATLAGCIIGLAVGIVQTIPTDRKQSPVRWALLSAVKFILSAYVEIFRGTPMMVQAMFIFYGVSMLTGVVDALHGGGAADCVHQHGRLYGGDGARRHPLN